MSISMMHRADNDLSRRVSFEASVEAIRQAMVPQNRRDGCHDDIEWRIPIGVPATRLRLNCRRLRLADDGAVGLEGTKRLEERPFSLLSLQRRPHDQQLLKRLY